MSDTNHIFRQIADATNIGHLGIVTPDGYPRVVPVNFATIDDRIYFHGANHGEKYDAFAAGQKVTFSIDIPLAMIPSYWRDDAQACRANQFFKSVLVRGRGAIVEDFEEKAAALQALMEKHQPEGGFRKISTSDLLYVKSVAGVGIYRIDSESVTVRAELGQNLSDATRKLVIDKLRERDRGHDAETAREMEQQLNDTGEDK